MARGNRAQRDPFIDIPAEAKEMLRHIYPAVQHMPKGERMDGVGADLKRAALALIPELRRRLSAKGVRLNEKKFYDQPYGHGVEFLGSHVKPWRIHLNDSSYARALSRVRELNGVVRKEEHLDDFVASINSYTGILKNRNEHKRTRELREAADPSWWEFAEWDERRQCVRCRPPYTHNARLNKKYHLNLKQYEQ